MISCFDHILKTMYESAFILEERDEHILQDRIAKKERLMMGITDLSDEDVTSMRNLTPKDINKLIESNAFF